MLQLIKRDYYVNSLYFLIVFLARIPESFITAILNIIQRQPTLFAVTFSIGCLIISYQCLRGFFLKKILSDYKGVYEHDCLSEASFFNN